MTVRGTDLSLLEHFAALKDPRQTAKVLYPLPEILLLVLAATLAGADDFVEVQAWGEERLAFLRRFLPDANGIPSHDTLNGVLNALDPELFKRCFVTPPTPPASVPAGMEPQARLGRGIARRPTGIRRHRRQELAPLPCPRQRPRGPASGLGPSGAPGAGCSAVGSATGRWADGQRLVLGQEAVAGKSNEITAIPLLLERLELAGALVTIDAIAARAKLRKRSWPSGRATSWR